MGKVSYRGTKKGEGLRITFDREARVDFVTGFKKRKDERRVEAKVMQK